MHLSCWRFNRIMWEKISLFSVLYSTLISSSIAFASIARHRQQPSSLVRLRSSADALALDPTRHDELLWGMIQFFGHDMVDSDTNRFYYICKPQDGECRHVHFPIRDLAAAWDGTKAFEFTKKYLHGVDKEAEIVRVQRRLTDAIKCTLSVYHSMSDPFNLGNGIPEDILLEPPNIGHSALLLLGMCNACRLSILERDEIMQEPILDGLANGILSMQMENGAFSIDFGKRDNYLQGIEFFPGEAMLSLMSAHELSTTSMPEILEESTRRAILPAMERAFGFYSEYYYTKDVDINYNIWQILAFAKYYDALDNNQTKREEVKRYILEMCQEICQSRSWKYQLARGQSFYVNLETVEIACGLDALAEGIRIAREQEDTTDLAKLFKMHATNGMYFLKWAQEKVPEGCTLGKGGLGYGGVQVLEQRLDVTGHAISALVKLRNLSVLLP